MEDRKEIQFRIYRYNPQVDQKPFFDNIRVTMEKGITILRALNYIKEHVEPRLTYRAFCQAGICGSCAMKINGVSKLACTTQVWDELNRGPEPNTITIEPLSNLPVMKDMVVDMDPLVKKLVHFKTWVDPKMKEEEWGKKECNISEAEFKRYDAATDCILCASCLSECTIMQASNEFVSPPVLLRAFRMNADSRDSISSLRLERLVEDHGVWDCTHCYRCVESCVKSIPIMDGIQYLRQEAIEKRGPKDTEGSRHAWIFMQDIPSKGRLVEATLFPRTLGLLKSIKLIPFLLTMARAGRVPPLPFMMKPIPGIKKVREMFKELKNKKGSGKS